MSTKPDLTAVLLDIKRVIASAKIAEFERQAYRIGHIVSTGRLSRAMAADVLRDAAVSNGLINEHGEDSVQALIAKGFGSGVGHE
jgi:Trk K+ transport system NAD-binding subunit